MSQTLGAFLSVMTVMLVSINFQAATLNKYRVEISNELEVMANAVVVETMEYIASKPFDQRTADGTISPLNPVIDSLTVATRFGDGIPYADAADVDDFNGMPPHNVFFETSPGKGFTFRVRTTVEYVDGAGNLSTVPTWSKQATVMVDSPDVEGAPFMMRPVVLTRQFSPQWY
jgi:hypothetical protein